MTEYKLKKCPECGQQLRFSTDIGGMLMQCPSCGRLFQPDFKLGVTGKRVSRSLLTAIFELPDTVLKRIDRYFYSRLEFDGLFLCDQKQLEVFWRRLGTNGQQSALN